VTAISFGIVAALMLLSAVLVVRTKDLVHAVFGPA
jgi:NADH:ubiquinone oxidoreductase subunit 6 (subunit J)